MTVYIPTAPALGSMVITRDGVWDYTYRFGGELPDGSSTYVKITTRTGAEVATFEGDISLDQTRARFVVEFSSVVMAV